MRPFALALPVLLLAGCAKIQTVAVPDGRVPPGSAITLHLLTADVAGVEHALFRTLSEAGFDVRNPGGTPLRVQPIGNDQGDALLRYDTPYALRLRSYARRSDSVESFTIQVIHVPSGRILLSQTGVNGTWSAQEIASALKAQL